MKHHLIEKNSMYKRMLIFFALPSNAAVWATFTRLVTEIANFVTLNNVLSVYMQQHLADIKGVTATKNEAFLAMVTAVVNKAHKAFVWALDSSNTNLAIIFDVQKSDFTGISETNAFSQIKNIRDALSENIDAMGSLELGAADIKEVNAAILAYQNTIGTPDAAKVHKTEGTQGVELVMHPIDKSLAIIDKLIISSYSTSNPDMVKEYLANRALDKLPTHHSGLYVHITDAATGLDIEGALLKINDKSTTSDIDGIAEIIKIRPGTYNASVSMANYATHPMKIVIEKGRVTELEVKLGR